MEESSVAFILLGSNLGDRTSLIETAILSIEKFAGNVIGRSSLYETVAIDIPDGSMFLNAAVKIQTTLSPKELLHVLLEIEQSMGRIRTGEVSSRPIDLDIGFYDNRVIDSIDLIVPHPRLHLRRFALAPLVEIASDFIHPVFNHSLKELLDRCIDQCEVSILSSP